MKKNTIILAGLMFANLANSQDKKFFDKMFLQYSQKKIEQIKVEIDKYIADPANESNKELWAWKTTIDAEMLNSDELKSKCTDCLTTSDSAFRKYASLDQDYKIISEPPFNWKPLGVLYDKFYSIGSALYKEKNWEGAFENFEKAAAFSKIIMKKDLRKNGGAMDTLPILMSGYAAQNAQKVKEALSYYTIAANAKFGGDGDVEMYKYILVSYSDLKDKTNFEKYFAIAQEKYPKENLEDYKLDFVSKNLSLDEKISMFDTEDAKGTLSANGYMYFGDMLVNLKKEDKEAIEKEAAKKMLLHTKGREAFKKAYSKNNDVLAGFNVGVLYFNEFQELDEKRSVNLKLMQEINTNKAVEKDAKKKIAADLKTKEQIENLKKTNLEIEPKIVATVDNAIEWLEKTFVSLKDKAEKTKNEKASFRNTLRFLGALYEFKKEKAKGKDPKSYDTYDAKSKQYYEMYDKK